MAKSLRLPLDMIAPVSVSCQAGEWWHYPNYKHWKKDLPVEREQQSEDGKSVNLHSEKR